LFRLFEVPKEKEGLIINADSSVQSYWTHIHNDSNHAPPSFKGFSYKSSGKIYYFLFYKCLLRLKF